MQRWRVRLLFAAIVIVAYVAVSNRQGVPAAPAIANPQRNASITQATWDTCVAGTADAGIPINEYPQSFNDNSIVNTPACEAAVLADINKRHAAEGVAPMKLPGNFNSLSAAMQLVTVVNAERASRHLPTFSGIVASLDRDSLLAARGGVDPNPSKGDGNWSEYNSIWAGGYQSALMADFDWMYNDGWGGNSANTINVDCKSARDQSCWGHRDAILANYALEPGEVLVAGGAVVTTGPPTLSLPSWAAAFESVPRSDISIAEQVAP